MAQTLLYCRALREKGSSPGEIVRRIGNMGIAMLKEILMDERGQSVVEYTLLCTLIGATTVFLLTLIGLSISQMIGVQVTWDSYREWAYEKFSSK
jgi:Flp pilus assembly pilin Flp